MSPSLGAKALAVLGIASLPMGKERTDLYRQACEQWSQKTVDKKFEDLAGRNLIEYGVTARTGWLTEKGKARLEVELTYVA